MSTPPPASQAMPAWSVKTRRAPSRHCRDARVYGFTDYGHVRYDDHASSPVWVSEQIGSIVSGFCIFVNSSGGFPIVTVCPSRRNRHYGGNRHYSACCHCCLFPSAPGYFTGTITGNRHYEGTTTLIFVFPTLGWRSAFCTPEPPSVTRWSMDTSLPTTVVSPTTMPVPWSMNTPSPNVAPGWMSI